MENQMELCTPHTTINQLAFHVRGGFSLEKKMENQMELSTPHMTINQFAFHGKKLDYLILFLKNTLLTILTLGLYLPFAKTEMRKFVWSHTTLNDIPFEYRGTGKEIFKGYVLSFLVLLGAFGISSALALISPQLVTYFYYALASLGLLIAPRLIYSGHSYKSHRTFYRGLPFQVDQAGYKEFRNHFYKGIIFIPFSLGLAIPYVVIHLKNSLYKNTSIGGKNFFFEVDWGELLGVHFFFIFLHVITFGLSNAWYEPKLLRFHFYHLNFDGNRFNLDLPGSRFFLWALKVGLLSILTLGLYVPVIKISFYELIVSNLTIQGDLQIEEMIQQRNQGQGEDTRVEGIEDVLMDKISIGTTFDF